jgi:hypothetical protein
MPAPSAALAPSAAHLLTTCPPPPPARLAGILCNWLVCLAVFLANAAQDISGKAVAIFLPVSAFVAMGFEHCIANQYVLPLALRLGSPITVSDIVTKNLLPATIGNIIGGAFFVATLYAACYGSIERDFSSAAARAREGLAARKPEWLLPNKNKSGGSRAATQVLDPFGSSSESGSSGGPSGGCAAVDVAVDGSKSGRLCQAV